MFSGDEAGGLADLEKSRQMAADAGLDILVANAYTNLGSCCGELYQFELAAQYLTEGIGFATARDFDPLAGYMRSWMALSRMYRGIGTTLLPKRTSSCAWETRQRSAGSWRWLRLAGCGCGGMILTCHSPRRGACPGGANRHVQRLAPVCAARAEAAWIAGDAERTIAEAAAAYDLALKHAHPWHVGELGYWLWKAGRSMPHILPLPPRGRCKCVAIARPRARNGSLGIAHMKLPGLCGFG